MSGLLMVGSTNVLWLEFEFIGTHWGSVGSCETEQQTNTGTQNITLITWAYKESFSWGPCLSP